MRVYMSLSCQIGGKGVLWKKRKLGDEMFEADVVAKLIIEVRTAVSGF